MKLGSTIKETRQRRKISQTKLATLCDITPSYLSLIEHNKKDPGFTLLKKIATHLDMPVPLILLMSIEKEDIPEEKSKYMEDIKSSIDPSILALLING